MEKSTQSRISLKSWLTLILLSIVWGSSFILIKKGIVAFDPYEVASMRIFFSALAFIPVVIYYRKIIEWKRWPYFLLVGLTGSGIPAFMYPLAQQQISSSVAGILNSLTPIFAFLIGIILFQDKFKKLRLVGLTIGLIGAAILTFYGEGSREGSNLWYAGFIVVASFCYAFNVNAIRAFFQETKPIIISAVSFCFIGLPAFIYLLSSDILEVSLQHEFAYWSLLAVIILALVGTVISTVLFFRLVQETSPIFAASVSYLMPIVAIMWGLLDGELMTFFHIIGMLLILGGIYLIRSDE